MRIDVPVIVRLKACSTSTGIPAGQRQGPNSTSDMQLLVKVWYNLVISDPFLLDKSTDELSELTGSFFSSIILIGYDRVPPSCVSSSFSAMLALRLLASLLSIQAITKVAGPVGYRDAPEPWPSPQ